jgi:Lar family restriction alleviation protein
MTLQTILDKIAALVNHPPLMLKACPFCGRSAILSKYGFKWIIECGGVVECMCHGPIRDTAADAAEAWNERS